MKSNPFYALSASAMLLGCWLLSQALHLQAGQLGGLLTLMAVLQLYEGLLVGLGTLLVRSGRAPRDGVSVLVLESVFLVDAPLLAAECVTADARVGTVVALVLAALAAIKLAWVRRAVPGLLSSRAALVLGGQAAFVLALPVAAAHLAGARAFGPHALHAMWWATLALPVLQGRLFEETRPQVPAAAGTAHAAWTAVPGLMVLLHLWAVGYIHAVDFRPAFLAPLLLGLAVASRRGQVARQVVLPGLATLLSLGQQEALGFRLLGAAGPLVSPLRLALAGVAVVWAYLVWRDRERWLAVLALGSGAAAALGSSAGSLADLLVRGLRFVESVLPRDAFGGGLLAVIAAFVLLGAGARRSLRRPGPPGPSPGRLAGRLRPDWRESAAAALCLGVFALALTAQAGGALTPGRATRRGDAGVAALAAAAACAMALRAHGRTARQPKDPVGHTLAGLAMAAGALGFLAATVPLQAFGPHPGRTESAVIGDVRAVVLAQAAYQAANHGFYDSRLDCLGAPAKCIPAYPRNASPFLDASLASLEVKRGYARTFVAGEPAGDAEGEAAPELRSKTSVRSFAYVAVPASPGSTGVRGFCGDSSGALCFTDDGRAPGVGPDGQCDLSTCTVLQ